MKYKAGDRVVCNGKGLVDKAMINEQATIVYINAMCKQSYLLQFDHDVNGHDGYMDDFKCPIGTGWWVEEYQIDLVETNGLKFKKGDKVIVKSTEYRESYKCALECIGTIVDAEYNRYIDDERITYRVRIDNLDNKNQVDGLWVFHKEKSLVLFTAINMDDCIARAVLDQPTEETKTFNIKGETNNMYNIVEIYKDRKRAKIDKKYKELRESVENTDPRYKTFKECVDTLDRLYEEDKVVTPCYTDIQLSKETIEKLIKIDECHREEVEKLHKLFYEVVAQLQMCETYEQKQAILKTYKIVKENGKINA